MQTRSTSIRFSLRALFLLGLLAALALFMPARPALAATITVCASGCDYTTIQDAVNAASPGDTISVSAGIYAVPSEIALNKANLTLQGAGSGSTIVQVSGTGPRFNISASDVKIDGFGIQKTDKVGVQDIIYLGANNATITNNEISGQYVFGDGDVSRALIFTGGLSGLTISNNTIHGIRQPGYISGVTTGTISNNNVYLTRGWVVEEGNMTFTGNTWGTGANSNIYDIVILSAVSGSYYTDIPAMAAANNDAFIEDQRTGPPTLSIVYVDGSVGASGDGTARSPKKTIGEGVTRVVIGGTIHVLAGTYAESVTVNKVLTLDGAGSGSNPAADTIISGSGSGTGLLLSSGMDATHRVVIKDVRATNFDTGVVANSYNTLDNVASVSNITYGINLSPLQDLDITNSKFNSNNVGLKIASTASVDDVTISNSEFNSNTEHGWYSDNSSGSPSNITNLNVSYTTFNDNVNKGFYTEKLSDAVFDHITVNNSGNGGLLNHRAGMDFNLKYGTYSNIQITNSTITNNGHGDANGGGILIKARSTGSYAVNPATLDGVTLTGLTVTSNGGSTYAAGIRIGESNNSFTGTDTGPTNVVISNSGFSGNSPHAVRNATAGTTVLAESNWWGNSSGPHHPTTNPSGTGGAVGDNVDYSPWWNLNYVGDSHVAPWTWRTNDSFQRAIDLASAGDSILANDGTYVENVTVNKSLWISGASQAGVIVQPAISDPNCGGAGGGSLCAGSSNVFLVQADNVTIQDLTVDGDNPALTSAYNVGGANLDARNGIITNHNAGTYNNLEVYNTTVKNIYLRGIQQASGGTFDFYDNTVTNVQAETASIAMFNYGGTGYMTDNTVSYANDAISSNYSTGTEYSNNTITNSGSGIHTDNNGGSGGNADTIHDNQVSDCTTGGYGVWVFVPYKNVSVTNNTVTNCSVGLSLLGGAGGTPTFSANTITGDNLAGGAGAYLTTNTYGYGDMNAAASLTNNSFTDVETGIAVEKTGVATMNVTETGDTFTNTTTGIDVNAALTTSNVTATASGNALDVKSGGSVTANNTLDLNGNATIESGGTLAAGTTSEIRVAGNWSNSGTFTPGTGKVKFDGAVAQSIGGSVNPAPFNDLDLSNTHANGITSSVDATVAGQLAMNQDSNLDMGANTMTMGASSNPATAGTGQGDVVGQVKRTSFTSGTSYNFGSPFLAFNDLTFTTAPTDIRVTLATSEPGTYPTAIQRTYTLNVNGGAGVNTDLQLHYRDDASTLNGNTEASLGLHRYNGSSWDDLGYDSRNVSNNWVQRDSIGTFSDWTLANSTPTSATLTQFSGRKTPAGVELNWETGAELNLLGFNIWRARGKGEYVQVNAELVAVQNPGAVTGSSYLYLDPLSKKGRYRYKLEMLTTSGSDWSDPIKVRVKPAVKGCANVVEKAQNLVPKNKAVVKGKGVRFDWADVPCATRYELTLRKGSATGAPLASESNLQASDYTVPSLKAGVYFWSVRGCNATSCGPTKTVRFTLERNK